MTKDQTATEKLSRTVSAEDIEKFREMIRDFVDKNPDCVHEADVRRIHDDRPFCRRLILSGRGDWERVKSNARKCLEWRNSIGLNDMIIGDQQTDDALRNLATNTLFPYKVSKSGAHVLMFRTCKHVKPKTEAEILAFHKSIAFLVDQMTLRGARKIVLVFDCQDAGLANIDVDSVKFTLTLFSDYNPYLLEKVCVVEMPWLLQATWKMIKAFLPADAQKIILFLSKKQLGQEIIEPCNLPTWLDGTNAYCYNYTSSNPLGDLCSTVN